MAEKVGTTIPPEEVIAACHDLKPLTVLRCTICGLELIVGSHGEDIGAVCACKEGHTFSCCGKPMGVEVTDALMAETDTTTSVEVLYQSSSKRLGVKVHHF